MNTEKPDFWHQHIKAWKKSRLSQAEYCAVHELSTSNFSKWKKKIAPGFKAKTYRPKSKYSKFTKLSDKELEALMQSFFNGESVQETAKRTGISSKTIFTTYLEFQERVVTYALTYPHLFFYAGTLLLLGPPPDSKNRLDFYSEEFEHRNNRLRSNEKHEGKVRNNNELTFRLLTNYMTYEWSLAESFVFREVGLLLYYIFTYSNEHDTTGEVWGLELHKKMAIETNLVVACIANMTHCATVRNDESFFEDEKWDVIFRHRKRRAIDDSWVKSLVRDLKWALERNPIKGNKSARNTYWDKFAPTNAEVEEAKAKLQIISPI